MLTMKKNLKYTFSFFLLVTLYYAFVFIFLVMFADPQFQRFEQYHRLSNWDLKQHARGDFDGDGQIDLISFTGCAFLSSVQEASIPQSQRCTANGISEMVFRQPNKVGQKYVQNDQESFALTYENRSLVRHSYMGKMQDAPWSIFVRVDNKLEAYEITPTGLLQPHDAITLAQRVDEKFYSVSQFFFLFSIPLLAFSLILSLIFEPLWGASTNVPIYGTLILATITLSLYFAYKHAPKKDRTT